MDNEQWRSGFNGGVDNLVRTFDYKERPQVFKYYPQYYHKTDKVCAHPTQRESLDPLTLRLRTVGLSTSSNSATST